MDSGFQDRTEWGSGGRGFTSRRPDWLKVELYNEFRCGAFSSTHPNSVSCGVSFLCDSTAYDPMRRVQRHILDRLRVGLLVRRHQRFLRFPTARRGDILRWIPLPLRGPLPADLRWTSKCVFVNSHRTVRMCQDSDRRPVRRGVGGMARSAGRLPHHVAGHSVDRPAAELGVCARAS